MTTPAKKRKINLLRHQKAIHIAKSVLKPDKLIQSSQRQLKLQTRLLIHPLLVSGARGATILRLRTPSCDLSHFR